MRCLQRNNKKHSRVRVKHGQHRIIECIAISSYQELIKWEQQMIIDLRTFHHDWPEGLGSNFTRGGEGTPGHKQGSRIKSNEERRKISESKKRLYSDPEERRKLGEAIHKAKLDPEKYKNHCIAQRKRYSDPRERLKAHEKNTQKKRVQQLTLDDDIVAEFSSLSYAVQATGVKNIKLVCQGKRRVAGGYKWRYLDEASF